MATDECQKIESYKAVKIHGSFKTMRKFNPRNGYSSLGWRRDHEKTKNYAKKFSTSKNLNQTKILRLSVANVLIWFVDKEAHQLLRYFPNLECLMRGQVKCIKELEGQTTP